MYVCMYVGHVCIGIDTVYGTSCGVAAKQFVNCTFSCGQDHVGAPQDGVQLLPSAIRTVPQSVEDHVRQVPVDERQMPISMLVLGSRSVA